MIKPANRILSQARSIHVSELKQEISIKKDILLLSLSYFGLLDTKKNIEEFKDELKKRKGKFPLKRTSLNWFLKPNTKKEKHKVNGYDTLDRFFNPDFTKPDFANPTSLPEFKNEVRRIIGYFTEPKIETILGAKPKRLYREVSEYQIFCSQKTTKTAKRTQGFLSKFLFNYPSFTSPTEKYDAYQLTRNLQVEACLYCNRIFSQTVTLGKNKIIRPELDHFLPKSKYPLLAISFYNLVPSCHICNSNLKGDNDFDLENYVHPFLESFDDHKVKFSFRPVTPLAFFDGHDDDLDIKLDTSHLEDELKKRIDKNIKTFQLDSIYDYNSSYIYDLQKLKRLTNEKYINWLKEKLFLDEHGNPMFSTQKEVYEAVMLNYYDPIDYVKRPMAKFVKDLSEELGLI